MNNINTQTKAIILIMLSVAGYIIQMYMETKGMIEYNQFLMKYTINSHSGLISLFTSAFMHGGLLHIGMNMVALYGLSTMFNPYKSKLVPVYIYSLILSSLFSYIYVHLIGDAYVLGASGAIFGLFSYIFFKHNKRKEFYLNFLIFNGGAILLGMNLAWYSHLGGAIAGILYYYFENDIMSKIKRNNMKRI